MIFVSEHPMTLLEELQARILARSGYGSASGRGTTQTLLPLSEQPEDVSLSAGSTQVPPMSERCGD